jgi:hypothetical protein
MNPWQKITAATIAAGAYIGASYVAFAIPALAGNMGNIEGLALGALGTIVGMHIRTPNPQSQQ